MAMHWVVVGDGAGAKVYESDALLEELALVDELHMTHGHVSHGSGAETEHAPGAGEGTHEAHHDHRRETEERFARAVAQVLNDADVHHRYERVVLVAPPRFLGDLRNSLSRSAGNKVVASINHDWTKLHLRELSTRVRGNLPDAAGM